MNIALANVIRTSASRAFRRNKTTKTKAVFRKLSLKAAKNWHQNRGAKRLDSIIGDGMPALLQSSGMLAQAKKQALRPPEPYPTDPSSRSSVLFVGIDNHRPQGEAEGDADDDAKQREPHGVPPKPGCKRRSLATSTHQNGPRSQVFLR